MPWRQVQAENLQSVVAPLTSQDGTHDSESSVAICDLDNRSGRDQMTRGRNRGRVACSVAWQHLKPFGKRSRHPISYYELDSGRYTECKPLSEPLVTRTPQLTCLLAFHGIHEIPNSCSAERGYRYPSQAFHPPRIS